MCAHLGANAAAAAAWSWFVRAAIVVVAGSAMLSIGGCMPAPVALAGRDPADPAARVAPVGYRSTLAPYTPIRPSEPKPWREPNDNTSQPPAGRGKDR